MARRRFKDNCPTCKQEVLVTWAGESEELSLIKEVKFFCAFCRRRWFPPLERVEERQESISPLILDGTCA